MKSVRNLFQVTKINNEKIAVNPHFVMTVSKSDVPTATSVIQFPPSSGSVNTLYVQETFEEILSMIENLSSKP